MSLSYPIARNLEEALAPGVKIARTQREAASLSPGLTVEGLETGWLHLTETEAITLLGAQGAEGPAGHLQRYEDTSGHVVVAVSWWKLVDAKAAKQAKAVVPPPAVDVQKPDHTDDLYFRQGRTKPQRGKSPDPNQLDLFRAPKG